MRSITNTGQGWVYSIFLTLLLLYIINLWEKSVQAYTGARQDIEITNLRAMQEAAGIHVEWQMPVTQSWSGFTVYHSQDCQWKSAAVVTAPVFSSVDSETNWITYTLLDENPTNQAHCSYWVVGTKESGSQHTFGPVSVQRAYGLYLPVVYR
jgi:hypothetical protein